MKTQHTPGPWTFKERENGDFDVRCEEFTVATVLTGDAVIDPTLALDKEEILETHQETKANARLIAAAPELLQACYAALSVLAMANVPDGTTHTAVEAFDAVRSAIAKAEEAQ